MSEILSVMVDHVWGMPLVILLIGGGIYLLGWSRLDSFRGFIHGFKLFLGLYQHDKDKNADGQISHFQALCNALSATIGVGNIAGVAVAITQGGPGAIFWMWVAGLIGMNTKFFECTLSVMYRGRDYRGEIQGGPMYVIQNALPKPFFFMAILFSIFGLVGTLPLFQVNQLASFVEVHTSETSLPISAMTVGWICAVTVAIVLWGGLQRLSKVTSALVPVMCLFYVICALVILFIQREKVVEVFGLIFTKAFGWQAAGAGGLGYGLREVMKTGVKRAAFSNEAGVGTAPMAHSNVKTQEPVSEGLVALIGPFLDTIVVCTMTALVILTSLPEEGRQNHSGILMTVRAFENSLPHFGATFLGIAVLLFSFTTILGTANYNQKCWNFLFKGKGPFSESMNIVVFCGLLVVGATWSQGDIVNILDISFGLMTIPNMVVTLILAPKVMRAMRKYFAKHLST